LIDCTNVPGGSALPGTPCDDGDATTGNDVYGTDCTCAGQLIDCTNVPGGSALPGTPCDDGNPSTDNDVYGADCSCAGQLIDCTSEAGPDQTICGFTATMQAAGIGNWSGPANVTFTDASAAQTVVLAAQPGSYDLYWTVTVGSCIGIDTVTITFNAVGDASFAYAQSSYCHGDPSATPWVAQQGGGFTAFPSGLMIDSSSGTVDIGNSAPGTYQIAYAIGGTCPASENQSITIAADADASWSLPAALCSTGAALDLNTLVTGTPGGSWIGTGVSNGVFDPSGLSGAVQVTYSVSIGSCTSESAQSIMVLEPPVANAGPDVSACGLRASMSAVGANGSWSLPTGITPYNSLNTPAMEIGAAAYGTYALVWSVTNGTCSASDTALVSFIDPVPGLGVDAGEDQFLAVVDHTWLLGSATAGANLSWWVLSGSGSIEEPNDSSTAITGLGLGDNLIVLTASINPCASVSDTVLLHVDDLFIPEGYSPNGDGSNDRWEIRGIEAYPNSALQVFNRWGKLVFEADAYANEWDGRSRNGQALPDDTYFYVLNLSGQRTYNGPVIIKR
jgi:gliding motility-associated-like protein